MPRKSILEITTPATPNDAPKRRLIAGESVPAPARAIFSELVGSVSEGHFAPADRAVLEQLSVAIHVARELAADIAEYGVLENGKVRQSVKVLKQQQALIGQLASRLRLTTQNRISKDKATTTAKGGAATIAELYEVGT